MTSSEPALAAPDVAGKAASANTPAVRTARRAAATDLPVDAPLADPRAPAAAAEAAGATSCPAARLLEVLGRKHMLSLLHLFFQANPRYFNQLRAALPLSPKTLSDRLKELVELEILRRTPLRGIPPRVEYRLTLRGAALEEVFTALDHWQARFRAGAERGRGEE